MKLVNVGSLKVAKKFESAIKSIEKVGNEYTIKLNDGYMFEWNSNIAIEFSQKEVLSTLQAIQKVGLLQESEVVERAVIDESSIKNEQKIENVSNFVPTVQFIQGGDFVENQSFSVDIVTSYLQGTKSFTSLTEKYGYAYVMKTLELYNLEKRNYANFKGIKNNGTIFSCLKFYKRYEIISLFELKFYGFTSKERKKASGINAGLQSSHFRMKVAK